LEQKERFYTGYNESELKKVKKKLYNKRMLVRTLKYLQTIKNKKNV